MTISAGLLVLLKIDLKIQKMTSHELNYSHAKKTEGWDIWSDEVESDVELVWTTWKQQLLEIIENKKARNS